MNYTEAAYILGLDPKQKLDEKTIAAAYARVIAINHPDRSGSPFLTQKIIQARKLLGKGEN